MTALFLTAAAPPAIAAGIRHAPPQVDCGALTPALAARAAIGSLNGRAAQARTQAQLGKRGELTGRYLTVGGAGAPISVTLPVESSVGAAVGDLVVYTSHTPASGSEVRAVNLATGCDTRLATPSEIVRSALLDGTATALYFHSVSRTDRADSGITRYDLASGTSVQVLPGLGPKDDIGPIFGTTLRWNLAGTRLAIQSCGFSSCLTRAVDPATGAIATFDIAGQGAFVGMTRAHLVTFASCPGLPCAVLSTDVAYGDVAVLAEDAYVVSLAATADGNGHLSIQTASGNVEIDQ
ncbi:MAG: hypothetical protein ABIP53_11855 [Candidatus Limnocylindrales bacterium]